MAWGRLFAPTVEDIRGLAEAAFDRLPETFRERLDGIVIVVEDFPDDEALEELGADSPYDLLGLYRGVDLTRKSVLDMPSEPDMIFLFRRPILDVWADGDDDLGAIVTHVLVHEIGHHFGLSDDDMDEFEEAARQPPLA